MKNSISPQPTDKVAIFEDKPDLPPKPTPRHRSRPKQESSPYGSYESGHPTPTPIHRTVLTVEASKVSSDAERSDDHPKTIQKRQKSRRSSSVVTTDSRNEPITTHFPVSIDFATDKNGGDNFDQYGGYILSNPDQKSSHAESGYLSALELSIPISTGAWSQASPLVEFPKEPTPVSTKTTQRQDFLPPRPSSRGTIFDRKASVRSKSRASTPETTRRVRLSSAKSESNLRRYERSNSLGWILDALKERVQVKRMAERSRRTAFSGNEICNGRV